MGSAVLDCVATLLDMMGGGPDRRKTGDSGELASSRVSPLLALSFSPTPGRPTITSDLRRLIQRIASENALWGAPRIHGELLKLGFEVSERTVSRYIAELGPRGDAGGRW